MRRHVYDRLDVTGELTRVSPPGGEDALGRAVRHLRRGARAAGVADGRLQGEGGRTRMPGQSLLKWEQVTWRSDAEIWAMFGQYTDKYIESIWRGVRQHL